MDIRYELMNPTAHMPARGTDWAAGFDLYADEDIWIPRREHAIVSTGVKVAIPEGYAGLITPRSGLAAHYGITVLNAPGLIDPDYRGELGVILVNLGDDHYQVTSGSRIAQLVIIPAPVVNFVQVEQLLSEETARGNNGFGSTGR